MIVAKTLAGMPACSGPPKAKSSYVSGNLKDNSKSDKVTTP
jgi:hypothetical protein